MKWKKSIWRLPVCGLIVAMGLGSALVSPALAIVINSEDGAGNTTPPEDDPGFHNVGILNSGSGIYLGNRWVLSAAHVGPGTITLNGQEYTNVVEETVRIENTQDGLTPLADMILMRLTEDPGLPSLRLSCRSISINTDVLLVGGGRDRESEITYWSREDVPGENNDIWTILTSEEDANESGYFTKDSRTVRWGTSRVTGNSFEADSGKGDVTSFQTDFFKPGPIVENSAQAVRGDSGGAVFQKNGGIWELAGMIHAVGLKENQPLRTDTAVFGATTFIAELRDYADQLRLIADFEPAPGDFNGDGEITTVELDELLDAINGNNGSSCHYDLTGNGSVTHSDFNVLLAEAETLTGDANLDGTVGFDDFLLVARSFGKGDVGWANGDFDGDKDVTFGDFLLLSMNFGDTFTPAPPVTATPVPEPSAFWLGFVALLVVPLLSRRRR